ncbi:MAG: helix-turn-helix domain-containing protein [Deltaproteobacteria bacterium]|nr:helix-turn-helix domain-containing protein [Deltaproteobacteria bacterium]
MTAVDGEVVTLLRAIVERLDVLLERAGPARNRQRTTLPGLLTVEELAETLRVSRAAAYKLIERQQVPGIVRRGRRVLISSKALSAWLQPTPARRPEIGR